MPFEYKVIKSIELSLLSTKVSEFLSSGWTAVGGVSAVADSKEVWYLQAVQRVV
jgi:hypothetical protein